MKPPHQSKRILKLLLFAIPLFFGVFLILTALNENTQFFYNPSDIVKAGFVPDSEQFRIGGLVVEGSVVKDGELKTIFDVKDFEREMDRPITVEYTGVLPDLFREGQGVVLTGILTDTHNFQADEVLAKHDENYKPEIKYQSEE